MKKRLLITSIVMMLVVAVALSTATYAWFTSNATVTANSITMYAQTNSAASIGISWTDSNYGTNITAVSPSSSTYYAPTAISTLTTNTAMSAITWSSATIKDVAGNQTFNDDEITAVDTLAYTWQDDTTPTSNKAFYIHNGSDTNELDAITATVTITGEATDFIRVGFFKYDTTAGAFKLKGVITDAYTYTAASGTSVNATEYYNAAGELVLTGDGTTAIPANSFTRATRSASTAAVGTATGAVSTITNTTIGTSVNLGGLDNDDGAAGGADVMQIKVLVWMDGTALNDSTATTNHLSASVVLHFDAHRGTYSADTFAIA